MSVGRGKTHFTRLQPFPNLAPPRTLSSHIKVNDLIFIVIINVRLRAVYEYVCVCVLLVYAYTISSFLQLLTCVQFCRLGCVPFSFHASPPPPIFPCKKSRSNEERKASFASLLKLFTLLLVTRYVNLFYVERRAFKNDFKAL